MKELYLQDYLNRTANNLPPEERLPKLPVDTHISVIVPAYNEEAYIKNLLVCLNLQDLGQRFELVVVDNSGTDRTSKIVSSFASKSSNEVFVINETKKGAGNARKAGVDEIVRRVTERDRGNPERHFIALTDADTKPNTNWLSEMYKHLSSSSQSLLISGNYTAAPEIDAIVEKEIGIKNYFSSFMTLSDLLDRAVGQTRMRGPNSGLEIECYVKAGGFRQPVDGNGNTAPRECFDLAVRIAKVGTQIEHFNHVVIASQRRKLYDLINNISSYDVADPETGRFLSTRSPEGDLLHVAVNKISFTKWYKYQEKIYISIVRNTLLFPMFSGIKKDIPNTFNLEFWNKVVEDSRSLDIDALSSKWGLILARELLRRATN